MRFNAMSYLAIIACLFPAISVAEPSCPTLQKVALELHQRFPSLSASTPVNIVFRSELRAGRKPSPRPADRIAAWLEKLELTHRNAHGRESSLHRLRKHYYRQHVIQESEIPEAYFQTQRRIARELGHGDIRLTPEWRHERARVLIEDQKRSLDAWINYFLSPDTDHYPFWAKFWAFSDVSRMASFDPTTGAFPRRGRGTALPFPELNREALGNVIDARVSGARSEPFLRRYGAEVQRLRALALQAPEDLTATQGTWVRYPQGSDPTVLVNAINQHNTGWCTANLGTARSHLQGGDFHVFYSHDSRGKPTVPRIAIRMEGTRIGEVRGVAANQNLDPHIVSSKVLTTKLSTFGSEADLYRRRTAHMARVTEIERSARAGEPLSTDHLRFLYEVDEKVQGFGYERDPRIDELLSSRNIRQDLAHIFNVEPSRIALTSREAISGNIAYYRGSLALNYLHSAQGVTLPQRMTGDLFLQGLTSAQGLILPRSMNGHLDLSGLTSAEGLTLPPSMNGSLSLHGLTSAQGLVLPHSMNGRLALDGLTSAQGLILPRSMNGHLDLDHLTSAEGLTLPHSMNGNLYLDGLTSARGLTLPRSMNGTLSLDGLTSVRGLVWPTHFSGQICLSPIIPLTDVPAALRSQVAYP